MTRAETILAELAPLWTQGYDQRRYIPTVIDKCEPPAYTIDQEAGGADRAQRAIDLMIDHLESQVPPSKMVRLAVLLVRTSPSLPLLLRESSNIRRRVDAFAGEEQFRFQMLQDDNSPVGDRLSLSLIYWLADKK